MNNNNTTPLSVEVMNGQATINLATLGHVSHGKSSLVETLTGTKPLRHSSEIVRNITIKLGYSNFKVFKCEKCPCPECYFSTGSNDAMTVCTNKQCNGKVQLIRHFSFVDCPGHDALMATMLSGASVVDAAVLVIASNQTVPQLQTAEHLVAAEMMNLKDKMVVVQTKLDLLNDIRQAKENYEQIQSFVNGTIAENAPVIPVSCVLKRSGGGYGTDVLLQHLVEKIPVPVKDFTTKPYMNVLRSFDVNNPGISYSDAKGGVIGGSLVRGALHIGQDIEVRPGLVLLHPDGSFTYSPLITKVVSLYSEQTTLQAAYPGGLIGVGTNLDPTLTKADKLIGNVIGLPNTLPDVYIQLELEYQLLHRMVGVKTQSDNKSSIKTKKISKADTLMLSIGTISCYSQVIGVRGTLIKVKLNKPVCVERNDKVALSRKVDGSYRLIGVGVITSGQSIELRKYC